MKDGGYAKRVGVYTLDKFLFQKIRLEFLGLATVEDLARKEESGVYDLFLIDLDSKIFSRPDALTMSRTDEADISLPFRLGTLASLIEFGPKETLSVIESTRSAAIGEKTVRLTELEYALLSALMEKRGEYVTREELLYKVWGKRAEKGILNVYIHYLREKLEQSGEKIILSSRNYGYKINEKYLGENSDA